MREWRLGSVLVLTAMALMLFAPAAVAAADVADVAVVDAAADAAAADLIETVGFDEAVRRAVANNHDVARAAAAILRAEALLGRARAAILPTAELYASETVVNEELGFGGSVTLPRNQFAVGGTLTVPVLAASAWAARTQAADRVEIARLEAAEIRRQISIATAEAYLAVIGAARQVEVDERARDNARSQYDYGQTRFEGGAGSRLDALRAADVLSTNEVLVEQSHLALRLSREGLGVLLAADGPVDAAEEPVFAVPDAQGEGDLSSRIDLRLRVRARDAAARVLNDSWKDRLPEVVATFDPLYVDPPGAFQESSTWRAVLEARIPIDFGGAHAAARRLRRAALETAEIDLDQAELMARSELRNARAAVEAAERGLIHARAAAAHANEVLTITDGALRAGARTNIELIDAQRRARDAESAVARAEDLLRQAKLDLLVALGLFGG
jgi:outer membrane protein TolC